MKTTGAHLSRDASPPFGLRPVSMTQLLTVSSTADSAASRSSPSSP